MAVAAAEYPLPGTVGEEGGTGRPKVNPRVGACLPAVRFACPFGCNGGPKRERAVGLARVP